MPGKALPSLIELISHGGTPSVTFDMHVDLSDWVADVGQLLLIEMASEVRLTAQAQVAGDLAAFPLPSPWESRRLHLGSR